MDEQPSARHDQRAYRHARALRRPLTPTEAVLWRELRAKRFGGFKFRRQQPIGPYVADFFCAAARLVVEFDGDSHVGREENDARRTAYLEAAGLRVVRFWNPEVYDNLDGVLTAIYEACGTREREARVNGTLDSPALVERGSPLPLKGGGEPAAMPPDAGTLRGEPPARHPPPLRGRVAAPRGGEGGTTCDGDRGREPL